MYRLKKSHQIFSIELAEDFDIPAHKTVGKYGTLTQYVKGEEDDYRVQKWGAGGSTLNPGVQQISGDSLDGQCVADSVVSRLVHGVVHHVVVLPPRQTRTRPTYVASP